MTTESTLSFLSGLFDEPQIVKTETVQSLWSGYGELARYYLPEKDKTIVVKHIQPAHSESHPRGWNTDISHQRKLKSYEVEVQFYRTYSESCDQFCRVPTLLASHSKDGSTWLVLEDLNESSFTVRFNDTTIDWIRLGLRWLAYFHACHLGTGAANLWQIGTYWHLATRPDELITMPDNQLKRMATLLDEKLNAAHFQTLVHGDAKLANFCFHENRTDLAAVDFQYVGKGVGIKDIAYYLGSCFLDEDLHQYADALLDEYFVHLNSAFKHYQLTIPFKKVEQEWRSLYSFAWADFNRFLSGWSPGHYKMNSYMQSQTDIALSMLES